MDKNLNNIFVISSPSGGGKSSLIEALLLDERAEKIKLSVSFTTREIRSSEKNQKDYIFIKEDEFTKKINDGDFIEYAKVFGNLYGTPLKAARESRSQGKSVVFDVDWQGGKQIRSSSLSKFVISIFILPPSIKELHERLMNRAQDSSETVKDRMKKSIDEIMHWKEYDYVIVNNDFEQTLNEVKSIITSEKLRRVRNSQLEEFIETLTNEFEELKS